MAWTAAHCDGCSPALSSTMRTARSRTSGENLLFLPMAPSSQHLGPPGNPARFTPGTVDDGTIVWEYRGHFDDTSFWEPVIASLPTMLTVDVSAGGTITLTADEAGHDRIKLTGNLAAAVTLVVEPGSALGWVKSFLNATDDAFSINVQATTGGGALAAPIPPQGGGNPKAKLLFADDTNVYEYM